MFFNWLLNTIFPINCLRCGIEGKHLCSRCIKKQKISLKVQNQEAIANLDGVIAFFDYNDLVII